MSAASVARDIGCGRPLPGYGCPICFADHAVERFAERLRQGLDLEDVLAQPCRLLATAKVTRDPPSWLRTPQRRTVAYLHLGDDVCLPLCHDPRGELVAVTALTPTSMGAAVRERRADYGRRRRAGRAAARQAQKRERGRQQSGPAVDEWQ